jgi:hypothetical protein
MYETGNAKGKLSPAGIAGNYMGIFLLPCIPNSLLVGRPFA